MRCVLGFIFIFGLSFLSLEQGCSIHVSTSEKNEPSTDSVQTELSYSELSQSKEPDAEDAGSSIWEDRSIEPLEGLHGDAGIPEGYVWGQKGAGFTQNVLSFRPAKGASFGHQDFPKKIQGPPRGGGDAKGSLDVVSLGCGGSIILEFSNPLIGNGPGPDFILFENAFFPGGGKESFAEPAQVSVSIDGKKWFSFPCQPKRSQWPYPQCAGVRAVYAHPKTSKPQDLYDPKKAGGDAFDLADVGLPFARFVKIEDKTHLTEDASAWCGMHNAGFDLDAAAIIWGYRP